MDETLKTTDTASKPDDGKPSDGGSASGDAGATTGSGSGTGGGAKAGVDGGAKRPTVEFGKDTKLQAKVAAEKTVKRLSMFHRFFERKTEFFDMLIDQAKTTLKGMEALETWITTGAAGRCQVVRDFEHKADDQKFALEKHLADTLITPLDREDIYDLSANLDEVINAAKQTAREIEAFGTRRDDPALAEMAATLVMGTKNLVLAFEQLNGDLKEAAKYASLARKADSKCEKVYRRAMKELFELDDTKTIMRTVEVYKTLMAGGNRIDTVGEKLLHVIIKIG